MLVREPTSAAWLPISATSSDAARTWWRLRRTQIGELTVREAAKLDAVTGDSIVSVEEVLKHLPRVTVDDEAATLARNGRTIELAAPEGDVLLIAAEGAIGVFESSDGKLRPATVLGKAS